jgi:hypothetical protein
MFNIAKNTRVITNSVICDTEDEVVTLYTCPANARGMMNLLFLSNSNGNTDVSVLWVRQNGAQSISVLGGKNVASGEYLQFSDGYIVFEAGDYMTVTASGNSSPDIHALATIEEIFVPVGG